MSEQQPTTHRVRRGAMAILAGGAMLVAGVCAGGGGEAEKTLSPAAQDVNITPHESDSTKGMAEARTPKQLTEQTEQMAAQMEKANKDVKQPLIVLFRQLTAHPNALTRVTPEGQVERCNVVSPDDCQTTWRVSKSNNNGPSTYIEVHSNPLPDGSGPDLTNPRLTISTGVANFYEGLDAHTGIKSVPDTQGGSSAFEIYTSIRHGDMAVTSHAFSKDSPENMEHAMGETSRVVAIVTRAVNS